MCLRCIKLLMYLFFMELILNDFEVGKSITRAIGSVGPGNLDFFGPKWHSLCSLPFHGPKSLDFQDPLFPIALVMDSARLKIITYRAI